MANRIAVVIVSHKAACDLLDDASAIRIALDKCLRLRKVADVKLLTTERLKPHLPSDVDVKPGIMDISPGWWETPSLVMAVAESLRKGLKTVSDLLLVAAEFPLLGEWSINGLLSSKANCYTGALMPIWKDSGDAREAGMSVFAGAALVGNTATKWSVKPVTPHESLCLTDPRSRRLVTKARELGYTE